MTFSIGDLRRLLLLALLALAVAGCRRDLLAPLVAPTASPAPTPTLAPTPIPADSGWETIRPGMEKRILNLVDDESGRWLENVTVVRLAPDAFRFGVAYRPGAPHSLEAWQAQTGSLLVVNGGFYTEAYVATGLIISDGVASGVSYQGFGGMFAVTEDGPVVRSLRETPYDPAEPLRAALQSFPLLLAPGGRPAFPEEDGQQARRTVVAQDESGRLLFLVANRGHFTLHRLSRFMESSDLDVDVALNLDGGPSSGLFVAPTAAGDAPLHIPSYSPLPAVITVHEAAGTLR